MSVEFMKMHFNLLKYSKNYDDYMGFYFLYLLILVIAVITNGIGALYVAFIISLGISILFFSTEAAYTHPLITNSYPDQNYMILENSLPVGRKRFIKGKVFFSLTATFFSILLQIPSFIALFVISYRTANIDSVWNLQLLLSFTLSIHVATAFSVLRSICKSQSTNKSKKTYKTKRIISILIFYVTYAYILLTQQFNVFDYIFDNLYVFSIAIPLLLALATFVQFLWSMKNIQKIDFYN